MIINKKSANKQHKLTKSKLEDIIVYTLITLGLAYIGLFIVVQSVPSLAYSTQVTKVNKYGVGKVTAYAISGNKATKLDTTYGDSVVKKNEGLAELITYTLRPNFYFLKNIYIVYRTKYYKLIVPKSP